MDDQTIVVIVAVAIVAILALVLATVRLGGFRIILELLGLVNMRVETDGDNKKQPERKINLTVRNEARANDVDQRIASAQSGTIETQVDEKGEVTEIRHKISDEDS